MYSENARVRLDTSTSYVRGLFSLSQGVSESRFGTAHGMETLRKHVGL